MIVTSLGTVIGLSDGQRTNLQDLMLILGLIGVTVGRRRCVIGPERTPSAPCGREVEPV